MDFQKGMRHLALQAWAVAVLLIVLPQGIAGAL
jgi:hypothetical protein